VNDPGYRVLCRNSALLQSPATNGRRNRRSLTAGY
jgi:hypothetical protein